MQLLNNVEINGVDFGVHELNTHDSGNKTEGGCDWGVDGSIIA